MVGDASESESVPRGCGDTPLLSMALLPAVSDPSPPAQIEVCVEKLSISAPVVATTTTAASVSVDGEPPLPTMGHHLRLAAHRLCRRAVASTENQSAAAHARYFLLRELNAVFTPGSMTLVLGPPGSGKSALLRALSGHVPLAASHEPTKTKTMVMHGRVTYNGSASVAPQRVGYVAQRDHHFAMLTVRETLTFAHACSTSTSTSTNASPSVSEMLRDLGLDPCADTLVGNALVRGISGGERKRVTLGEMLFGERSLLLLDEVTTGLDAAATLDILTRQRRGATRHGRTVVMALLQPSPEVFALFDNVLLLQAGHVLYHGPRHQVGPYFASLGLHCPTHRDMADFLLDLATPQQAQYMTGRLAVASPSCHRSPSPPARGWLPSSLSSLGRYEDALEVAPSMDSLSSLSPCSQWPRFMQDDATPSFSVRSSSHRTDDKTPPRYPREFADRFTRITLLQQQQHQQQSQHALDLPAVAATSASTPSPPCATFPQSFLASTATLTRRQSAISLRNTGFLRARAVTVLIVGLLYSTLFFQVSVANIQVVMGVLFAAMCFLALGPSSLVSTYQAARAVHYKQRDAHLYRTPCYVVAFVLAQTPIAATEAALFGSLVYWVCGFARTVSAFLYFEILLFVTILAFACWFFLLAALCRDLHVAKPVSMLSMMLLVLFAGFIMTSAQMPVYFRWIYVINPIAWALRGLAVNQYRTPSVDQCTVAGVAYCQQYGTTMGVYLLRVFDIPSATSTRWVALLVLVATTLLFMALATLALEYIRFDTQQHPQQHGHGHGGQAEAQAEVEEAEEEVVHAIGKEPTRCVEMTPKRGPRISRKDPTVQAERHGVEGTADALHSNTDSSAGEDLASVTTSCSEFHFMQTPRSSGGRGGGRVATREPQGWAISVDNDGDGVHAALPAHYSMEDGEGGTRGVTLAFKELWYSVPDPNDSSKRVHLLQGVSGVAYPGTMTALMGSSGAGKTTLMDVIAGRKAGVQHRTRTPERTLRPGRRRGGEIHGEILLNGFPATPHVMGRVTGYCEQVDVHSEAATIREALLFSAILRTSAPRHEAEVEGEMSEAEKKERMHAQVDECLDLLGLRALAGRMIRGLSVEQLKRVTIGVELAAQPSMLFLDEPTSGLDAQSAKVIMDGLRRVATQTGRTVVCTIHQPSWEVFQVFDSLLLLKRGGETVYFGDIGDNAEHLISYFESLPGVARCSDGYTNPAAWMLDVIGAGVGGPEAVGSGGVVAPDAMVTTDFVATFQESEVKKHLDELLVLPGVGRPLPGVPALTFPQKRAASEWLQAKCVVQRFVALYWRTPSYVLTRYVVYLILAIVFGFSFRGADFTSYQGVNAGVGMIFISTGFTGLIALNSILPLACEDRAAFYRERVTHAYRPLWYVVGSTVAEIPYVFSSTFLFVAIVYPLVGFPGGFTNLLFYWFNTALHVLLQTYLGQLLAYALPRVEVAAIMGILLNSIVLMFMGYNPPGNAIPTAYQWLYHATPQKYTLAILTASVFGGDCSDSVSRTHGNGMISCERIGDTPPTVTANLTVSAYVEEVFQMKHDEMALNMGVVLALLLLVRVLALLSLRFINHQKR